MRMEADRILRCEPPAGVASYPPDDSLDSVVHKLRGLGGRPLHPSERRRRDAIRVTQGRGVIWILPISVVAALADRPSVA